MSRRSRRSSKREATLVIGVMIVFVLFGPKLRFVEDMTATLQSNPLLIVGIAITLVGLGVLLIYLWLQRRKRRRLQFKTLGELLMLSPQAFEEAVADLLRDLGYRDVKTVGGAGDLAADITCRDSAGQSVVVQCKRYAPGARVGSPNLQTFIGMITVHHRADRGIFVTTSEFSRPAIELAQQHGIRLIDGPEISRILVDLHRPRAKP